MKKLVTDRCYLAKIDINDKDELIKIYTNSKTRKFLGGALSVENAIKKFDSIIMINDNIFSVRLKSNHTFIGLVYILPYYDTGFYELSYEFLPEFWGYGYAIEVIKKCLSYCKGTLLLDEIFAETQKKNIQSRKLLEKLGYTLKDEIERFNEKQMIYSISLKDYL